MINEISSRTVETLYHVLATLHIVQRRPVKVLQGVGQHRLAVRVLAALGHHNVLAMFSLCRGTRRHDHCAVVRSADVGQHNWSIIPIHQNSIDLVQDSGLSSRLFDDLFQWIAGECESRSRLKSPSTTIPACGCFRVAVSRQFKMCDVIFLSSADGGLYTAPTTTWDRHRGILGHLYSIHNVSTSVDSSEMSR